MLRNLITFIDIIAVLRDMKRSLLLVVAGAFVGSLGSALPVNASVNVTQEHNNLSRDGVYIAPGFTTSAAANLSRDTNFNGTISGNVLAQPLYIEGGPNGPMVIAVTESNNVYALNAITGNIIWQRNDSEQQFPRPSFPAEPLIRSESATRRRSIWPRALFFSMR